MDKLNELITKAKTIFVKLQKEDVREPVMKEIFIDNLQLELKVAKNNAVEIMGTLNRLGHIYEVSKGKYRAL